jgi:hypothetical protein
MEYMPNRQRCEMISGFDRLVHDRISASWQPYFLNFMFARIPGRRSTIAQVMADEVSRVYNTLLTCVVRRPKSPSWKEFCPIFIGCPDLSVAKSEKNLVRNLNVNDGLHFNGCLLLPPPEKCRLGMSLKKHFERYQERYYRDEYHLDRIHVTYIEDGTMIDYAFKHFKRGNVSYDDILILPRSVTELGTSHTRR